MSLAAVVAAGLFVLGAVSNLRYLGEFNAPAKGAGAPGQEGFRDFRDAAYTPATDLRDGRNPYDHEDYLRRHPGQQEFDLYVPSWLTVHVPLTAFPYDVARAFYVLLLFGASIGVAWAVLRVNRVQWPFIGGLGLAGAILLSLPGEAALRTGQAMFPFVMGSAAALYFGRRRPHLAGLGLAVMFFKPQLGLPMAVLLWAGQRTGRAVRIGVGVTLLASVPAVIALVLAADGTLGLMRSLVDNANYSSRLYGDLGSPELDRIDGAKVIGTLAGMDTSYALQLGVFAAVLVPAVIVLRRTSAGAEEDLAPEVLAVLCLATLAATPHFKYDSVLLVVPVVALAVTLRQTRSVGRCLLLALMLIPFVNGRTLDRALQSFGLSPSLTSAIDSGAILVGFAVAIVLQDRRSPGSQAGPGADPRSSRWRSLSRRMAVDR